jgi:hypothetical protein
MVERSLTSMPSESISRCAVLAWDSVSWRVTFAAGGRHMQEAGSQTPVRSAVKIDASVAPQ